MKKKRKWKSKKKEKKENTIQLYIHRFILCNYFFKEILPVIVTNVVLFIEWVFMHSAKEKRKKSRYLILSIGMKLTMLLLLLVLSKTILFYIM